ncbi:MAG: PAS domain-containing protein [Pirellulaceae bacterium]
MSKATLLIVEDEAIVAADLAAKLRQLDYAVAGIVARGDEAIVRAISLQPDLVLMDISLEGATDGIAAAEAIRHAQDIPVVYLTAHSDPGTLARAKLTGPFGYILKPFDERELATQIELALYKHHTDLQLRQQREWLHITLSSIGDAVIATDAVGRIAFVNPMAESITGWSAEEAVGQPVQEVLPLVDEQTGARLKPPGTDILRHGRTVEGTNHTALRKRDGRVIPVEENAAPIRDARGDVIGVVLVFHDVTDKRRAEAELRESEERYRSLFSRMTDGFALLEVLSDGRNETRDYRFLEVNPAFERLAGRQRNDVIGHGLGEIFPNAEAPWLEHLGRVASTGEAVHFENYFPALQRWYEVLAYRAAPGQLAVILNDVTAHKQTQEALEQENRTIALANRIMEVFVPASGPDVLNKALQILTDALPGQESVFGYLDERGHLICRHRTISPDGAPVEDRCGPLPPDDWHETWAQAIREKCTVPVPGPCSASAEPGTHWRALTVPILFHGNVIGLLSLAHKHAAYTDKDLQLTEALAHRIAPMLYGWIAREMREHERKVAEEALRRAKEDWEETFNTVPDSVAILDTQHRIIRANQAMAHRLNKTAEQCVGLPCCHTHAPLLTGIDHQEHTIEVDEPRLGGTFLVTTSPRLDAQRRVVGEIHVARDITRLKQTERALQQLNEDLERRVAEQTAALRTSYDTVRAERQRFYDLLETLPVYIVLLRSDHHVSFANRYFREQFGEAYGQHGYDDLFQCPSPREQVEIQWALPSNALGRREWTLPDGRVYDIYSFPFTDTDGSTLILEMGINITDRRRAEEEMLHMKDELAHVDRTARMGELAASLAHELNQPLTAILCNAQAARRFVAMPVPDMAMLREILDDIIRDDKRAGSVIQRLRAMLHKGKPELETFHINDVVGEVVQLLHSEIAERNVSLLTDFAPRLSTVEAGRVEIQQVLVNLLLNALDALEHQPPEDRKIVIRTSSDEQAVVVAVQDRGDGIRSPDVNSIFEPFFTTKSSGLGMGLAISRRIIQAHGGRIWAANCEDAGATISFSLPCTQNL